MNSKCSNTVIDKNKLIEELTAEVSEKTAELQAKIDGLTADLSTCQNSLAKQASQIGEISADELARAMTTIFAPDRSLGDEPLPWG